MRDGASADDHVAHPQLPPVRAGAAVVEDGVRANARDGRFRRRGRPDHADAGEHRGHVEGPLAPGDGRPRRVWARFGQVREGGQVPELRWYRHNDGEALDGGHHGELGYSAEIAAEMVRITRTAVVISA